MIVELGIAGLLGSIFAFGRRRPEKSTKANGHGLPPGNPLQLPPLIREVVEGRGNDRVALIGAIAEARMYGLVETMVALERRLIAHELEQRQMIVAPPVPETNTEARPPVETQANAAAQPPAEAQVPAEAQPPAEAQTSDERQTPLPFGERTETQVPAEGSPVEVSSATKAPKSQKNGKGQKIVEKEERPAAEATDREEG